MNAIEKIKDRLSSYPELKYTVVSNSITIEASIPDGFSVTLVEDATEWVVCFDGWHEHFDIEDEALNCFLFGLSNECRLEITSRGTFPYRWAVQKRTKSGWKTYSITCLLFFPFWRRKRAEHKQNDALKDL